MAEDTLDQITVTLVSKPSGPGGTGQGHQTPGLSLAQARARASFSFDQPGYIPADFDFDDAAIVDSPSELVVLSFSAPTGNFLLVVAPVSQYQPGDDGGGTSPSPALSTSPRSAELPRRWLNSMPTAAPPASSASSGTRCTKCGRRRLERCRAEREC